MKLLIPLILALVGLGGGLVAGQFMRPPPPPEEAAAAEGHDAAAMADPAAAHGKAEDHGGLTPEQAHPDAAPPPFDPELKREYVKLDGQFITPLVEHEEVTAMLIISLSVEVDPGLSAEIRNKEPKLRDRFLKVLFRHAQSGAFRGAFTNAQVMGDLRGSLLEEAQSVLGPVVHDVLVTDIIRQDL